MLGVMLLWSINYNNSMGFLLSFLLGGVAINALWRTIAGLSGLQIRPGSADSVFVGQEARFSYLLDNPSPQTRYGIALQWQDDLPQYTDIPAYGSTKITLSIPATARGLLWPGRLRVLTRFPLGLFKAWSWVEFNRTCLVYPKPYGTLPLPSEADTAVAAGATGRATGSDDYGGLRSYAPGDSPRHIAWKAAAREGELQVKRFTSQVCPELWLDWGLLAPDTAMKTRLSQLCQWVLKAEAEGWCYGLRLPGLELRPSSGKEHRRRCLENLALFAPGNEMESGHGREGR